MTAQNEQPNFRNYATISPSAKALLLLKGHTPIPFARQAAQLIQYPEPYTPDFTNRQPGFWVRVMHFEARYVSINQLLTDLLPPTAPRPINILELSSGFSFRGLDLAAHYPVYYIDTDLPEIIATKQQFISSLDKEQAPDSPQPTPSLGYYELRPLNALDEAAFNAIIDDMPPGEIIIVNEGLLMYLNKEEKQRLCGLIRKALLSRGGYWITADIYLKKRIDEPLLEQGDTLKKFLEEHKTQDNMFESFEEATDFFTSMGFTIDKEAHPDYGSLSALPHFLASATPELLEKLRQAGKVHATWRLRAAQ